MKKLLAFALSFLLSSDFLFSQTYHYIPLIDSSEIQWATTCSFYAGPSDSYYVEGNLMHIDGDTFINGINYRKIWEGFSIYPDNVYYGAVVEDSLKKVYVKSAADTSLSIGEFVYDFSLKLNDTFQSAAYDRVYVYKIDTISLDGLLRKRFFLTDNTSIGDTWIEGIGSIRYGLTPFLECPFYGQSAMCEMYKNGVGIYLDTSSFCSAYNAINNIANNKMQVAVYPNPVSQALIVSILNYYGKYDLNITTISGQAIYSFSTSNSETKINTANFSKGIYFLQIKDAEGNFVVKKILKE